MKRMTAVIMLILSTVMALPAGAHAATQHGASIGGAHVVVPPDVRAAAAQYHAPAITRDPNLPAGAVEVARDIQTIHNRCEGGHDGCYGIVTTVTWMDSAAASIYRSDMILSAQHSDGTRSRHFPSRPVFHTLDTWNGCPSYVTTTSQYDQYDWTGVWSFTTKDRTQVYATCTNAQHKWNTPSCTANSPLGFKCPDDSTIARGNFWDGANSAVQQYANIVAYYQPIYVPGYSETATVYHRTYVQPGGHEWHWESCSGC